MRSRMRRSNAAKLAAIGVRALALEQVIVLAVEDPDLERHARGVGAQGHVIALRIHDALGLALFLFHDVAENAAFLFRVPFARGAQFVQNSARHKRGRGDLRVRVRTFLSGQRPVILVDGNIFEAEVALQILDALPPGLHHQQDLVVAQVLEFAVVLAAFR